MTGKGKREGEYVWGICPYHPYKLSSQCILSYSIVIIVTIATAVSVPSFFCTMFTFGEHLHVCVFLHACTKWSVKKNKEEKFRCEG